MPCRRGTSTLWLLFLLAFPGCATNEGTTSNPALERDPLVSSNNVQTDAKPLGHGLFADGDPSSCRVTVRSLQQTTNAVRNQIVLVATVTDKYGQPWRGRQVEWLVQGAGNILEVDESGLFERGKKVTNTYAISYTDRRERLISCFTRRPKEDFKVQPGESWCIVQSAAEGDTNVTVYAPDVVNHDNRTATLNLRWVDAEWTFPEIGVCRAGGTVVLTTSVYRHTDHLPLSGYKVRYRHVDGPGVLLGHRQPNEEVITTDLSGFAGVSVTQPLPAPGRTRLNVQIIRPPDPSTPSGSAVVIGEGEAFVDWQSAQVTVSPLVPASVVVGQDIPYVITLTNSGPISAQAPTVRAQVPDGLQLLSTNPPTVREGDQIVWTLADLAGNSERKLTAVFRSLRAGTLVSRTSVLTGEGQHDEKTATCQVQPPPHPQLEVQCSAPPVAVAVLGSDPTPVNCQIVVSNPGTGPTANTVVRVALDPVLVLVLEHASRANPIELPLGALAPGEKRPLPLPLLPRQAGRVTIKVTVTADGDLAAHADQVIDVQEASLQLTVTGPPTRYVGQKPATWNVEVSNAGKLPVTDVVVRCQLPVEIGFTGATEGGRLEGREVVWTLGTLKPDDRKPLQFNATAVQQTPQTSVTVLATGRANGAPTLVTARARAVLEVKGLPAVKLQVLPQVTPIEVGATETVTIRVLNEGSVEDKNVQVVAQVPAEFKLLSVGPAGTFKVDGQRITFTAVPVLPPNQMAVFTVQAQAVTPATTKFTATVTAGSLTSPLTQEAAVNVH
jgi:uncharacterized repeat protein (TIGR01451 family)